MKREYPDRPFVGIGVVVWHEGRVLLVKRAHPPLQGQWGLPGGGQELGETIFDTAKREVEEEAGILIETLGVITALDLIDRDEAGVARYHYTIVEIAARAVGGALRIGDEITDARFVLPDDIPALETWDQVARVVDLSRLQLNID